MSSTATQMRHYEGHPFFSFGFRPFFLGGAALAATLPFITALSFAGVIQVNTRVSVVAWHGHEMLYGYLGAVVAGFILTAVPNWTGRLPVMGWRLASLFTLWLAGRIAFLAAPSSIVTPFIDAAFLIVMDVIVWREVISGKNWRNAPVCLLMGLFAFGNVLWHIEFLSDIDDGLGSRWGLAVITLLLALIGGRIIPSFTRNWLAKAGGEMFDASFRPFDKAAIGILAGSIIMWVFAPMYWLSGALLITAALTHFVRLSRWKGWRTLAEPLVAILHVGYLWLATALFLLGVSALSQSLVSQSTAIHALTAGAAGSMTLAVMTRATLGHTGRALSADYATVGVYWLVNLGVMIRLAAPYAAGFYNNAMMLAGAVWGAAFLAFVLVYGRYLIMPRRKS